MIVGVKNSLYPHNPTVAYPLMELGFFLSCPPSQFMSNRDGTQQGCNMVSRSCGQTMDPGPKVVHPVHL